MRIITLLSITALLLIPFFGQAQNALNFDKVDDYVQTSSSGVLGNSTRTVEAWINTPYVVGQEVIVDWGTFGTGQRFTVNLINGKLRVEVQGSGFTSTTYIADSSWHHVAVTFDNSLSTKFKMYIDGVLDASFNISTAVNTGTSINLRIGARIDNAFKFSGKIDEIRIWNVERTAAEILSNMTSEFCNATTSLIAYYKFNQGTANGTNTGNTTLVDFSGNFNNGILNNFALTGDTSNWVSGVSFTQNTGGASSLSVTTCNSYTSPGGSVLTTTGIYGDIITNAAGCDSIITTDLTILASTTSSATITSCNDYVSPSGNILTINGIYQDTIPNAAGCDSIITTDLTVLAGSYSSVTILSCGNYISPSGNVLTITGIYQDTIPNAAGCDSIITTDLTVLAGSYSSVTILSCGNYISPSGNVLTITGIYQDTIPNAAGCDSIITTDLTISSNSTSNLTITSCVEFVSPSGNFVWTSTGIYQDTIPNVGGCDSIITIDLTIKNVDIAVTNSTPSLVASTLSDSYQWLDCNNNFSIITGETSQVFTADVNGSYAVELSQDGCIDTSLCYDITGVGIIEMANSSAFSIYPNPNNGSFIIKTDLVEDNIQMEVFNIEGKLIISRTLVGSEIRGKTISLSDLNNGMYYIKMHFSDKTYTQKLVIQN